MLTINRINTEAELLQKMKTDEFVDFLYTHLDRFGDTKSAIKKSLDYAFGKNSGQGGFLLAAYFDNELAGELVINRTGMGEYIPENILVYVAVNSKFRNKGIGRQIVEKAISECDGDVALHVEYDNPAKRLYERVGFGTKYAEMRFYKEK